MRLMIALVLGLAVAGCGPSRQQLDTADYGPMPANYDQVVRSYLQTLLKDPDSARIQRVAGPQRGWVRADGVQFAWVACYRINAKNSFGGYTGFQPFFVGVRRGRVVGWLDNNLATIPCQRIGA